MDQELQEIVRSKQPRKRTNPFICIYFDEDTLTRLDEVCAMVGPRSRSRIVQLCVKRMLPTLKRQLAERHQKPRGDRRRMDRLGHVGVGQTR